MPLPWAGESAWFSSFVLDAACSHVMSFSTYISDRNTHLAVRGTSPVETEGEGPKWSPPEWGAPPRKWLPVRPVFVTIRCSGPGGTGVPRSSRLWPG